MQVAIMQLGNDSGGPFAEVGLFPDGVDPHAVTDHGTPLNQPVAPPFVVRPQTDDYDSTDAMDAATQAQTVVQRMVARGLEQAKAAAAAEQHRQELAQAAAAMAGQVFQV